MRAFDPRARHSRFEFLGSDERARLSQTFPFEEKRDVVYVSSAAEDTATELAVFVPPVEGGIEHRVGGYSIPLVDSIGAGDNFVAGFLYSRLNRGEDGPTALRYGNATAARSCCFPGGT